MLRTLFIVLLLCVNTRADYFEVRRNAVARASADSRSATVESVEKGTMLPLLDPVATNGWYHVLLADSRDAWIYRTFGRGFRGFPEGDNTSRWRARHLQVGTPQHSFVIAREGYVVGYDPRLKIPVWVQYELSPDDLSGQSAPRRDDFRPDPVLPAHTSASNRDYKEDADRDDNADFARGHMAPAADMARSDRVMSDSFVLSNMVPQVGLEFNSSVWEELERDVRARAKREPVVVITGVAFLPGADPPGQRVSYRVIGERTVAVPTHLYKIVLRKRRGGEQIFAVLMENRAYANDEEYGDFTESVDEIERATGLDFFSALDDDLESRLEAGMSQLWE